MLFGYELPEGWIQKAILIALVIAIAVIVRWVVVRTIRTTTERALERARKHRESTTRTDRILATVTGANQERYEQRAATMGSLLRSVAVTLIFVLAVLTVLAVIEVPLAPILATAGIGGVALGFGAQALVKDYLSGIFMIMEDQYGVGDLIDTGDVTGTVEEVGLRITKLRDGGGQVWYVRNGEILRIGNQTQGWSTAVADLPIGNDEDVTQALEILRRIADEVDTDPEFADVLLEPPTVAGVETVSATGTILRVTAKTAPNKHWGVKRALLQRSIRELGEAGFHGPAVPSIPGAPPTD